MNIYEIDLVVKINDDALYEIYFFKKRFMMRKLKASHENNKDLMQYNSR